MAKSQRFRKLRKSNKTWDAPVLPWIAGIVGGTLAAMAIGELEETARGMAAFAHEDSWAVVWAFLFGFAALAAPVAVVQSAASRIVRELRAYINVRPLTGERLVGADQWAMDAVFAENLALALNERPDHVVELGSGHSSVLIAQRLALLGHGHLTALDHLPEFAARTRAWIEDEGLTDFATVVHAPIADQEVEGETRPWYSMEELAHGLPETIDLLVVDGPPGKIADGARWPAVPLLRDRLAQGAVILLDDGDRGVETRIAHDWHDRLGGSIRYLPGGRGGWLLRAP